MKRGPLDNYSLKADTRSLFPRKGMCPQSTSNLNKIMASRGDGHKICPKNASLIIGVVPALSPPRATAILMIPPENTSVGTWKGTDSLRRRTGDSSGKNIMGPFQAEGRFIVADSFTTQLPSCAWVQVLPTQKASKSRHIGFLMLNDLGGGAFILLLCLHALTQCTRRIVRVVDLQVRPIWTRAIVRT